MDGGEAAEEILLFKNFPSENAAQTALNQIVSCIQERFTIFQQINQKLANKISKLNKTVYNNNSKRKIQFKMRLNEIRIKVW